MTTGTGTSTPSLYRERGVRTSTLSGCTSTGCTSVLNETKTITGCNTLRYQLTFADLVRLEPRLQRLLDEAHSWPARNGYCAHLVWYGTRGLKARMSALVGHERADGHKTLCSSWAYDLAYQELYRALPDCRHEDGCK